MLIDNYIIVNFCSNITCRCLILWLLCTRSPSLPRPRTSCGCMSYQRHSIPNASDTLCSQWSIFHCTSHLSQNCKRIWVTFSTRYDLLELITNPIELHITTTSRVWIPQFLYEFNGGKRDWGLTTAEDDKGDWDTHRYETVLTLEEPVIELSW